MEAFLQIPPNQKPLGKKSSARFDYYLMHVASLHVCWLNINQERVIEIQISVQIETTPIWKMVFINTEMSHNNRFKYSRILKPNFPISYYQKKTKYSFWGKIISEN